MRRELRIVVLGQGDLLARVRADLADLAQVAAFPTVAAVRAGLGADRDVPLVVVLPALGRIDELVEELAAIGPLAAARVLLLTSPGGHDDVARAVDAGRVDAFVALPMTRGFLAQHARSQVARWLRLNRSGQGGADAPRSELLKDMEAGDGVVEAQLLAALERALGPRPRLNLPAGVRLTRQGEAVDGVFVVLSGRVALTRHTAAEELLLHHASTGPVVGLLSLSRSQRAFFTATTTTDVAAIHLSIEQLDRALAVDPEVGAALAAVAIRGLAARLLRSEQLQVERNDLNVALTEERARLSAALGELEAARLELVAQARFATLGELAAGLAHELNNPVAALQRSADQLGAGVGDLLADAPDGAFARAVIAQSRARAPRSTAADRALRRELEALTDRESAWRLVEAGVRDADQVRDLLRTPGAVDRFEIASRVGAQLRAIAVAGRHIETLAASLRAYARPGDQPVAGVSVAETLHETLYLVSHRMRGIDVVREFGPAPPITCRPAQLSQVWTNILVNAAEALADRPPEPRPTITVTLAAAGDGRVRVTIEDNGPGIPAAVRERIFDPQFTTKHGAVRYGLGMGLPLAAHIVAEHGGTIELDTAPGRTAVTVTLPADE